MTDQTHLPCAWAPADDPVYRAYHDKEWGVPEYDSRALWEKLILDGFQAGLSWRTILYKRDAFREECDQFDPVKIAEWDDARLDKALQNPSIVRSRSKLTAMIGNAKAYLAMEAEGINFSDWMWSYVGDKPMVSAFEDYRDAPVTNEISEKLSKDLKKRGFKFCGPVIIYAFMQAVGMINDHELGCPRRAELISTS